MEKILSSGVIYFAKSGDFDSVKRLVRKNISVINIDEVDTDKRTVLSYASEKGDLNSVRMCLRLGANPQLSDKNKVTPLMYSLKNGNTNCTNEIISRYRGKESINFVDKEGWTALMYGAQNGRRRDIELLLENGADKTLKNNENLDARAVARLNGWSSISSYIEKYGRKTHDIDLIKRLGRKN